MPPAHSTLPLNVLKSVQEALPAGVPVFLVGGAVRDALLERSTHDLDLVLPGRAAEISRQVAHHLGAAYFPLDVERDTIRLIITQPDGSRMNLDFAALRGPNLESDLRDRDFTINAMALALDDLGCLIDPLGGAKDLRLGVLRACSERSFSKDPLRIVRAIRHAVAYRLKILPETKLLMRQALPGLQATSAERLRDELFRILEGPQAATSIRLLEVIGGLPYVLPELIDLKDVTQSPPHIYDVWTHTLNVLEKLDSLLSVLSQEYNPDTAASLAAGLVSLRVGRYRQAIHEHLNTRLNPDRSRRALLFLAALYHDIAKPGTRTLDSEGRIRFLEHDNLGAQVVSRRAQALRLSNDEAEYLRVVVRHHMRPLLLAQTGELPSRRAIYRFFRSTGSSGVDICLLALADTMATYGSALPQDLWARQIEVVRALFESWWEKPQETIAPPALVNGNDLIQELELSPGPRLGQLLEAIREAQAAGEISTRQEALDFAHQWLRSIDLRLIDQG